MRALFRAARSLFLPITALAALAGMDSARAESLPDLTDEQVASFRDLEARGSKALQDGDPAKSVRLLEKALAIHGSNEGTWYNLACARARAGRIPEALDALAKARDNGWTDFSWPVQDTDLAPLHGQAAFDAWLESLRAPQAAEPPWPTPDAATLAGDEDALDEQADARSRALARVAPVLGSRARRAATAELAAWIAASWDRLARGRSTEDERVEAELAALAAVTGREPLAMSTAAAAETRRRTQAILGAHPNHGAAQVARVTMAQADFVLANRSPEPGVAADALRSYERDLLVVAASVAGGPALEQALLALITLPGASTDLARLYHGRLRQVTKDPASVRAKLLSSPGSAGLYYLLEGLPDFEATTLDGRRINRASLAGKVWLIDFWATWCGPCRAELPMVTKIYERHHGSGFEILGISLDTLKDKSPAAFTAWCKENSLTWPQVYDGKGWETDLARSFGVRGIPFPLLVDREGKVVAAGNEARGEALAAAVDRLMARADAPLASAAGQ